MPASVTVETPGFPSQTCALVHAFTIGRAVGNDVVVDHTRVSRANTVLEEVDGRWTLRDLASRNGTFLNGVRTPRASLSDGDVIEVGPARLVFHAEGDAPEDPSDTVCYAISRTDGGFQSADRIESVSLLQQDYEKLRLAHELSRVIGLERDVDRVLERVVDFCLSVFAADHALALLMDASTGELCSRTARSRTGAPGTLQVSRSVVERVRSTGEALLLGNAMEEGSFANAPSICNAGIRSLLAVPLLVRGETTGILALESRSIVAAFQKKDLHLLVGIGGLAALALERTDLMGQIERDATSRALLCRFLSPALVEDVRTGRVDLSPTGQARSLVILFSDLRDFTAYSTRVSPADLVRMLNEHFQAMEEVIFAFGGVLDHYVGDCLMATWGAVAARPDDASQAVRCALQMQAVLADLNARRLAEGREAVRMGVGVHAGDAVVGCIGSSRRMDYTSHGAAVNLASRLCANCRAGEVLVSDDLAGHLPEGFALGVLETVQAKGIAEAIPCRRVVHDGQG